MDMPSQRAHVAVPRLFHVPDSHDMPDVPRSARQVKQEPPRTRSLLSARGPRGSGACSGICPQQALKHHASLLSASEREEVLQYKLVYYLGSGVPRCSDAPLDDARGSYIMAPGDHIAFRYQVLARLGSGSFGEVVRAYDHAKNGQVAIKVIRNRKRLLHQGCVEVKILEHLRDSGTLDATHVIRLTDRFLFRGHLCLVFPLLAINLYDYVKERAFRPLTLPQIRDVAVQLLSALRYMKRHRVIHCDLKPENIMLRTPSVLDVAVIDFGSGCFEGEAVFTYVQSRYYRAPEVILGCSYGPQVDMWSFGCILAELFTGRPLFAGENELDQFQAIAQVLGAPPSTLYNAAGRRGTFFDDNKNPLLVPTRSGRVRYPAQYTLQSALRCADNDFLALIRGCLAWDPCLRWTPPQALRCPWIKAALAEQRRARDGACHNVPRAQSYWAANGRATTAKRPQPSATQCVRQALEQILARDVPGSRVVRNALDELQNKRHAQRCVPAKSCFVARVPGTRCAPVEPGSTADDDTISDGRVVMASPARLQEKGATMRTPPLPPPPQLQPQPPLVPRPPRGQAPRPLVRNAFPPAGCPAPPLDARLRFHSHRQLRERTVDDAENACRRQ